MKSFIVNWIVNAVCGKSLMAAVECLKGQAESLGTTVFLSRWNGKTWLLSGRWKRKHCDVLEKKLNA